MRIEFSIGSPWSSESEDHLYIKTDKDGMWVSANVDSESFIHALKILKIIESDDEEKSALSLELDNQKLELRVRELEQKLLMAEATIAQRAELLTEVQDTATHYAVEAKDLRSKLFTALLDLHEYEKQFGKLPHNL